MRLTCPRFFGCIKKMYNPYIKRALDFCGALFLTVLLCPVMLFIACAILLFMGRPVVFRQKRIGLGEKPFYLYKFRTMLNTPPEGEKAPNDEQRLTALGKILRKSSLDELLQLFNVLKGDMSFVGPRPLLPRYLPYYTNAERLRHSVKSGITGLAQTRGRNNLSWDEKLALDVEYAKNVSFLNDLKIAAKTVFLVLQCKNVKTCQAEEYLDARRKKQNRQS